MLRSPPLARFYMDVLFDGDDYAFIKKLGKIENKKVKEVKKIIKEMLVD